MIKVGIIGCGYWGKNYIRIFNELPNCVLFGICDKDPDRLKQFPHITGFINFEELLPNVDAVVVATPAILHYDVVRVCLESGKHVLVEKPITTSSKSAEKLLDLVQNNILMVGFTFLYNRGVRELAEYIQAGSLGQLHYLQATRTNLGPIRKDVSALWDLAPHDISIFNYLLNKMPTRVSAVGLNSLDNGLNDVIFASLIYPGGLVGNIHVSWLTPNRVREVVLVGSKERVVFDDTSIAERIRIYKRGVGPVLEVSGPYEHHFKVEDGDTIIPKLALSEPLKEQVKHFVECIKNGQQPLSDGQMGLDVVRVLEAMDLSISWDGVPVEIL